MLLQFMIMTDVTDVINVDVVPVCLLSLFAAVNLKPFLKLGTVSPMGFSLGLNLVGATCYEPQGDDDA